MPGEKIPTHLIVRYLSNEASTDEQEQLFEWVAAKAEHQKIFNECVSLWTKKHDPDSFDLASGLQRLNSRIDEAVVPESHPSRFPLWMKLAASVALLLVAGLTVFLLGKYERSQTDVVYTEVTAHRGQRLLVMLSDSSTVKLNANSTLRYPRSFQGSTREVHLTGEAFFDVERDPSKPFIIHTGDLTTEVLGTSFNVDAQQKQVVVTVATGKVKVFSPNQSEILRPADKATFSTTTGTLVKGTASLDNTLAWKDNIILFHDTPLAEAAGMLGQWYDVNIHFGNEDIKKCVITGKYRNETLENILQALEYSMSIHYTIEDKEVALSGAGCE